MRSVEAPRTWPTSIRSVRVYRAFLGRAPDAGGLQFWIRRKRNVAPAKTWTVTQIATEFTNSNEFKTKYGSLTNRQFVTQIYTDVLGRAADPSGVNYWTGKLDRKEKTKAQVVVGFSESNEYKTQAGENTDVVGRLHLPDGPGADHGRGHRLGHPPEGRDHPRRPRPQNCSSRPAMRLASTRPRRREHPPG